MSTGVDTKTMQAQPSQQNSTCFASTLDADMNVAVTTSAAELFAHYKMPLQPCDEQEHVSMAAILGFTGEGAKGSLTLATSAEVLRKSCPVPATDDEQLADWAGELANQLLGRVKNKLLLKGLYIKLATPVFISGDKLQRANQAAQDAQAMYFSTPTGPLSIWVTAEWDQQSVPDRQCTNVPLDEGALSLF